MKKYILDLKVNSVEQIHEKYVLIKLTCDEQLPDMIPGQFVEVRVDDSPNTFLRRPISINFFDRVNNELWLLVAAIGDGTKRLSRLTAGDKLNCVLPLGHGFTMPGSKDDKLLLVGGGVGVAPLLYYGSELKRMGCKPNFLLGARSGKDLLEMDLFESLGNVYVTTEDGTKGEKGFVTDHSILGKVNFNMLSTCGPKPMMMAVARYAKIHNIECEVSLENKMACGVGACLCCVENTTDGNICVCKEGPVLNIKKLSWQL